MSEGAAAAPNAVGLVYLAAFMLDPGESLLDAMQHQLPDWIELDEAAGSHIAQRSEEVLYGDCSPEVAADAKARLSRQSVAAIATPQTQAAWQSLPSTLPDLRRGPRRAPARAGGDVGAAPRPCAASPRRTRRSSRAPTTSPTSCCRRWAAS